MQELNENLNTNWTLIVIGGGAAGFFGAITAAHQNPEAKVLLLEGSQQLLAKVRISGGGRCNVTHRCFEPNRLIQFYPRGYKELLGPFTRFQPRDTIEWFQSRGVALKTEKDGRVFPVSDCSQSIIDCLKEEARKLGIEIRLGERVEKVHKEKKTFYITLSKGTTLSTQNILLATGSNQKGYAIASSLGHPIVDPVPSLFTFNIREFPLADLAGLSVPEAKVRIVDVPLIEEGPLLITHWGFSGPAVLKFSAWGARILHQCSYKATVLIDWIPKANGFQELINLKTKMPAQAIGKENPFSLPRQLWKRLLERGKIDPMQRFSETSHKELNIFSEVLKSDSYAMEGKIAHKEEFVTCGGVDLKEVDFKRMESRLCPGLYFAGEILNIDGVTGGFNFQNAWTTGWIAGHSICELR